MLLGSWTGAAPCCVCCAARLVRTTLILAAVSSRSSMPGLVSDICSSSVVVWYSCSSHGGGVMLSSFGGCHYLFKHPDAIVNESSFKPYLYNCTYLHSTNKTKHYHSEENVVQTTLLPYFKLLILISKIKDKEKQKRIQRGAVE